MNRRVLTALLMVLPSTMTPFAQVQPPESAPLRASTTATVRLPREGVDLLVTKHVDQRTGDESLSAIQPDGRPADYLTALRREQTLAPDLLEKITPLLQDRLREAGSEPIPIGLWLHFDPASVDFRSELDPGNRDGAGLRSAKARLRERVARGNRIAMEPALIAIRDMGLPILSADAMAPVIFVAATAAEVEALAALPDVDRLYASATHLPMSDDAIRTHRWSRVQDYGTRGLGGRIAILDSLAIQTLFSFCCVNIAGFATNPTTTSMQGFHPSACAAVAGSLDSINPGHARGIEILSANSTNASGNPSFATQDLITAATWAINNDADIVVCPFGFTATAGPQLLDRYVDYAVRFTGTTFAVAAGNGLISGIQLFSNNVASPGLAYNCITVGAISDQDTPEWSDDVMAAFSPFVDPPSANGDREKPEVVAEGTGVEVYSQFTATGTSISASGVAGMCGVFLQVQPILAVWPEAMKAIVMAGATHNIEGQGRLSDKDGAGGVNGLQSYRIAENGSFAVGTLTPSSFASTGFFTINIFLQAHDKSRVVLAWDSLANSSYSSDLLSADLDIAVFQGSNQTSGSVLAASTSFDNSYEIVEFCPPVTGTYTVRINDFRFDGASEFYGLAWTQDRDGRHAHFRPHLPVVTANDAVGPTIGNTSFRVDPFDVAGANQPYICLASLGTGTGFDFPAACRHSFGDVDLLTYFSADPLNPYFLGFAGTLDATGSTTAPTLSIPDLPALAGLKLFLTSLTLDSAAPDGVREIAEIEPITIWNHATNLNLGDDGFTGPLALGFPFTFFGQVWTECHVNANGNITFGQGDPDFTEDLFDFVGGPPRIAPFWDDLNMSLGGRIRYRTAGASQFIVEWAAVPEFGTTAANQNSVIVILSADGTIEFHYGPCSLLDAVIGIAPGAGVNSTAVFFRNGHVRISSGALIEWSVTAPVESRFNLGTTSPYRKTVRFRPSGSGYVATFDER